MKIVVVIVVYNRIQNIKRWLECWKLCEKINTELVVIDNSQSDKIKELCSIVTYIPRKNVGFDIGTMQDVFLNRLPGFPDYDYLIWCTDDTLPMSKDFISPFIEKLSDPGVGISCMQISTSVNPHVRTTGFCIKKDLASKINFPVDPVITKQHCYFFEHRGGDKTFTNQVRRMGLSCQQVAPNIVSPLWDTGYWKRLDRMAEHERVFHTEKVNSDKVIFICPIYHNYPQIISSLICQTSKNWELMLVHDGPSNNGLPAMVESFKDDRIKYIETSQHAGNWGHKIRQWALDEIKERQDIDYVVITNPDNYHAPVYIEYMIKGFKNSHTAVATFCDKMVHNYKAWDVIGCRFERGYLDCAGVMVKKDIACEIGWNDTEGHSSDWGYFQDIASVYHSKNFIAVKGCLLIHN